jgi:peptide/nickel transport system permease protein/oligopeptide transport system permease protein
MDSRAPLTGGQRLARNPTARVCGVILGLLALSAFVGPLFFPASYALPSALQYAPPSWTHPFGTDLNGRDLLLRVLMGTRVSLVVGICGALVSLFIGTAYGLVAGYAGGRIDGAMMRLVDILYSIPRLIFILVLINAFNRSLQNFATAHGWQDLVDYSSIVILVFALGIIEWLTMARIVRGQVLALKSRQFVTAAQALGQSHFRILVRHLLPNLLGVIIIYLTLTIPAVIIDESFLSFLGLGIQAPHASLGSLLSDGVAAINPVRNLAWMIVFPSLAMALILLALNFLGDALRDALDPRR